MPDELKGARRDARPVSGLAPRIDSLTWLAWHTAREIDLQISALAGVEPLWTGAGFSTRFALPLPDDTEDWRHAPEQAALVSFSVVVVLPPVRSSSCKARMVCARDCGSIPIARACASSEEPSS